MMKKIFVFIFFILTCVNTLSAQSKPRNIKIFTTWIYTDSNAPPVVGELYDVSDSTVLVYSPHYHLMPRTLSEIDVEKIQLIKVRRKGGIANGMIIGGIVGLSIGAIIGVGSRNSNQGGFTIDFGILPEVSGTLVGLFIGGVVNAPPFTFTIGGKADNFRRNKGELKKRSIKFAYDQVN